MASKQHTRVELELRVYLLCRSMNRTVGCEAPRQATEKRELGLSILTCPMQHGVHILQGGQDLRKKKRAGARCSSQSPPLFPSHMKGSPASHRQHSSAASAPPPFLPSHPHSSSCAPIGRSLYVLNVCVSVFVNYCHLDKNIVFAVFCSGPIALSPTFTLQPTF